MPLQDSPNHSHTTVIVGMSGGVDSSVAALLLKRAGYHVEGLFMKNWEEDGKDGEDSNCSASADLIDTQTVCQKLGIRLHTVNFATEYWDHVFTHFLDEYKAGRTPNPDVWCNKEIKFKAFLDHALALGADYIATGHYVRSQQQDGSYQLLKGLDSNKDQSYFLYQLNQAQLSKAMFPVGELDKAAVRQLATEAGLRNADKKDSTGICFIGERRFRQFLSEYLPAQPGPIETLDGTVVGQHDGAVYYTIGQRQGLNIGGLKNATEAPWYVIQKDIPRNTLIVGQGHDHPALFANTLTANDLHWIAGTPPHTLPHSCIAKIRYRQVAQPCTITRIENNVATVYFDTPQRAIAPGQSVVFYDKAICLGGGIIMASSNKEHS